MSFPVSELGERYLRGDLNVVLHCFLSDDEIGIGEIVSLTKFTHRVDGKFSNRGHRGQVSACSDDRQLPMLIESVHVVNDADEVILGVPSTVVRLQFANEGEHSLVRDSTYFSVITGRLIFCERSLSEDGELNRVFITGSVFRRGKVPCNVIETRPKMMDNFPAQDCKTNGHRQGAVIPQSVLPTLTVHFGKYWVSATSKKLSDLNIEIRDVFVGPL